MRAVAATERARDGIGENEQERCQSTADDQRDFNRGFDEGFGCDPVLFTENHTRDHRRCHGNAQHGRGGEIEHGIDDAESSNSRTGQDGRYHNLVERRVAEHGGSGADCRGGTRGNYLT